MFFWYREIARVLADEDMKRVVIVDTSNEIGGDGDVPHSGIGRARRMQVPNVNMQHSVSLWSHTLVLIDESLSIYILKVLYNKRHLSKIFCIFLVFYIMVSEVFNAPVGYDRSSWKSHARSHYNWWNWNRTWSNGSQHHRSKRRAACWNSTWSNNWEHNKKSLPADACWWDRGNKLSFWILYLLLSGPKPWSSSCLILVKGSISWHLSSTTINLLNHGWVGEWRLLLISLRSFLL